MLFYDIDIVHCDTISGRRGVRKGGVGVGLNVWLVSYFYISCFLFLCCLFFSLLCGGVCHEDLGDNEDFLSCSPPPHSTLKGLGHQFCDIIYVRNMVEWKGVSVDADGGGNDYEGSEPAYRHAFLE